MQHDWEGKLALLQLMAPAHLTMDRPGEWYLHQPSVSLIDGRYIYSVNGYGWKPITRHSL